ncbi:SGNH/GDSL hydrolase family protein [Streptomyces albicerus]|uniref:SGNH/GDSL hydrolase family protein n=1 Tax=Streptomyces albicerus TaxID=2569859 RepID=UPI001788A2DD|nr:SGNH/GDSL hydrolase family protein [Streptomyces albicerus]
MNGTPLHEQHDSHPGIGSEDSTSLACAPWRRFIVLGDSGAKGLGSPRGSGCGPWADHVAEALRSIRPDLAYLNLGRRDHSAAQVRAKQLAKALAFRGDLAAVVAGGHEAAHEPFDVDATEAELGRIVGPLRDSGADVITLGPYGPGLLAPVAEEHRSGLQQRLRLLSERTRELALRHGALHVDVTARTLAAEPGTRDRDSRRVDTGGRTVAAAVIHRLVTHLDATETAA